MDHIAETTKIRTLVLATTNRGKIRELRELLATVPVQLKTLDDFPEMGDVEETGSTFRDNAALKARAVALHTRHMALADDSGLEVAALNNAPGIYSARYGGSDSNYDTKIAKLLSELNDSPAGSDRSARFVCVMVIANAGGEIMHTAEGIWPGSITERARGSNGFGYDPIFLPDGFEQTFGELTDEVKQRVSHRALAAELIIRYLLHFTAV